MTTQANIPDINSSISKIDRIIYKLLIIFIVIMPLIVFGRFEYVISPIITNYAILGSGFKDNYFSEYKSVITLIFTAVIIMLFIIKLFFKNGTFKKHWLNIFSIIFILTIIMSTLLSLTITISLAGLSSRSDGAISWICYITLLFIASQIILPKNVINHISLALIPFTLINFFIITLNFYGLDILQINFIKSLISSNTELISPIGDNSQLLGTLEQWNYMSGTFAMVAVFYFVWAITNPKNSYTYLGSILSGISVLIVLQAISTSGFLTLVICAPILIWIMIKFKNKSTTMKTIIPFFIIVIPGFFILNYENPRVYEESIGTIISLISPSDTEIIEPKFEDDGYLPLLPESASSGGSGRVYIWQKTIDLIKERPFTGYGMDTILYHFPHFNIDARGGLSDETTFVDKPHNIFLATFYGFGLFGFLCFTFLFLYTSYLLVQSIRKEIWPVTAFAIFGLAYFLQGLFNDSIVAASALAFVFIGLAANYYIEQTKQITTN